MVETTSISIQFFNELKDHLEAQRVLYKTTLLAKLDKVVAVLLCGFGAYCIYILGLKWWTVIWFPLAAAEWFNLLSPNGLRTRILFKRNPKFQEEYHLTFTLENIHFKTVSIDSVLQWTHYERVIESSSLFLRMYGKGLYTLIPKRSIGSEEEMNVFRALIKKKIP